ncbi:hypothetical protein FNT36_25130 [Hymenobacter setariae]|uniref:Uncharacterized protein n=1 Tax=Hymenobacter setariae TaxID=2594794 RepID=A0A558BJV8_9BACT|nr:hypothetical protein [Hymenobacter setariae]TVT36799.1 hypothetical protein FNT36_25130 [Hymenobacter setariae]
MSMITPTPAPQQPEISPLDWAGDPEQCPNWVGFPTRAGLPIGLLWSGSSEAPAIGTRVHIYMNSFGPAEVKAYFHADGYLGVICQPDQMPERLAAHGVTQGHFFGRELEPYQPGRAASAMVPEVLEIAPASAVAGPVPGLNLADDWIPDYPPQEGDELADDNQDRDEHPEHPQDEQRD